MDQSSNQKPNLLAEFAKQKAEAQKNGKTFGVFGISQSSRFPRPSNDRPSAKRGGRNGQGKPC